MTTAKNIEKLAKKRRSPLNPQLNLYLPDSVSRFRSPPAPLVKGGELIKFSSSPFSRGIEGDLLDILNGESNP
jgi:hypothetical protein